MPKGWTVRPQASFDWTFLSFSFFFSLFFLPVPGIKIQSLRPAGLALYHWDTPNCAFIRACCQSFLIPPPHPRRAHQVRSKKGIVSVFREKTGRAEVESERRTCVFLLSWPLLWFWLLQTWKAFCRFLANKMWPGLCTQEFLAGEKTIDWEWGSQKHRHRCKALVIFQARGDGGFDRDKPSAAFQHLGD